MPLQLHVLALNLISFVGPLRGWSQWLSQIIFNHLIQSATYHPWRVRIPSITLGERGVNTGKADGINCKKTGTSLRVNASAGQFSTPGTCLATIEKSCLAPRIYKHRNMWPGHKLFLAIPWRQYRYNYHIVTIKLDSLFLPTITPHCCYCHDW